MWRAPKFPLMLYVLQDFLSFIISFQLKYLQSRLSCKRWGMFLASEVLSKTCVLWQMRFGAHSPGLWWERIIDWTCIWLACFILWTHPTKQPSLTFLVVYPGIDHSVSKLSSRKPYISASALTYFPLDISAHFLFIVSLQL